MDTTERWMDAGWDGPDKCSPDDDKAVMTRIALMTGKLSMDQAVAMMGMDEVLRILGMQED